MGAHNEARVRFGSTPLVCWHFRQHGIVREFSCFTDLALPVRSMAYWDGLALPHSPATASTYNQNGWVYMTKRNEANGVALHYKVPSGFGD